jgi:hypothetical protein
MMMTTMAPDGFSKLSFAGYRQVCRMMMVTMVAVMMMVAMTIMIIMLYASRLWGFIVRVGTSIVRQPTIFIHLCLR